MTIHREPSEPKKIPLQRVATVTTILLIGALMLTWSIVLPVVGLLYLLEVLQ